MKILLNKFQKKFEGFLIKMNLAKTVL